MTDLLGSQSGGESWDARFEDLRRGMQKMRAGYPEIPTCIANLLDSSDSFPVERESPTGNSFFPRDFPGKHIEGTPEFGDECWQAVFLKKYPFPESHKKHPDVLKAIDTSLEIQNRILGSEEYGDNIKKIKELPILEDARNALKKSIGLRHYLGISAQGFSLDDFMRGLSYGAPQRLEQIVFSLEEAKHQEQIIDEIGNPISRVMNEIRRLQAEGKIKM